METYAFGTLVVQVLLDESQHLLLDIAILAGLEQLDQCHEEALPGGGAVGCQSTDQAAEDVGPGGVIVTALGRLKSKERD